MKPAAAPPLAADTLYQRSPGPRPRRNFACDMPTASSLSANWTNRKWESRFEGTDGMIQVGYGGVFTEPESLKNSIVGVDDNRLDAGVSHARNFLDCVRSRRDPIAHVEIGHRSATVCHLGNIAVRLCKKKVLHWDPAAERFTNDDEANAMLTRPMRAPWRIEPA